MAEKFFDICARISLIAYIGIGLAITFSLQGRYLFWLFAAAWLGSFLYIWYQARLAAIGKVYRQPKDAVLPCLIPLFIIISLPVIGFVNFDLLIRASHL